MSWLQEFESFIRSIKSIWNRQSMALKVVSGIGIYLSIRYVTIQIHRKYSKMPPGPVGIPIFGSFMSVAARNHEFYIDIAANMNYKLYTVPMGILNIIYINDTKLSKEIFSMDCCRYRPKNQTIRNGNLSTIDGSTNSDWSKRRRFFQTNLMTMLNKKFVEKNMKYLVNKIIIPKLKECQENNKLYFCHNDFQYVTFNIMYNCLFGGYLNENDELYLKYVKTFEHYTEGLIFQVIRYFILGETLTTFLRNHFKYFNKTDIIYNELLVIVKEWAQSAHLKYDKDNIQTYYDITYNELSKRKENYHNKEWDSIITRSVLSDFEVAIEGGTDTTAATLDFCIAVAGKHQHVQDEIYNEINNIIGNDICIDEYHVFDNLTSFNLVRAFVQESLRLMPIIPVGITKQIRKKGGLKIKINENTEYIIPDRGCIVANIIGMQRDPKLWNNPNEFNIKRWLNKNGKYETKHNEYIMNFTYGKRDCPGRPLALKSLYLMIIMLFYKYKFYYDEPDKVEINVKATVLLHVDPQIGCKVKRRK